jgi:tetratricopeptide (TPR) repeat protein
MDYPINELTRAAVDRIGLHVTDRSAIYVQTLALGPSAYGATVFFLLKTDLLGQADGILGRGVLAVGDTEYDLADGDVRLIRAKGCENAALAYWTKSKTYGVLNMPAGFGFRDIVEIGLNGVKLRMLLSPSNSRSFVMAAAAHKAGLDPSLDVSPILINGRASDFTVAQVNEMDFGGETIRHTRIAVTPTLSRVDVDGVLGMDFLLAHHAYVARRLGKVFITYNGGPIFNLDAKPDPASIAPAEPTTDPSSARSETSATGAETFTRRGSAKLQRHDWDGAIADLDQALERRPEDPDAHYQRAMALLGAKKEAAALPDLDAAVRLRPGDHLARMERAALHARMGDDVAARADLEIVAAELTWRDEEWLALGGAFAFAGDPARAIAMDDQWLDRHNASDGRWMALDRRCLARAIQGVDFNAALADCEAARRLQPKSSSVLADEGYLQYRRGDDKAAFEAFDEAVALDSQDAWALYGRGVMRLRLGEGDAGMSDQKAAEAIDPPIAAVAAKLKLKA